MIATRGGKHYIETPEGIAFAFDLAGPTTRFLAYALDFLVLLALKTVVYPLLFALIPLGFVSGLALFTVLFFVIDYGYAMALEYYWRGQTIGKWALGIRVMDEQGLRLSFSQIAVRNLLRLVDFLPGLYGIGGLALVLSPRRQRLGDFAANTIVVRLPKPLRIDLSVAGEVQYNSFRDYPHLEARLRQKVSPELAAVALEALARREDLADNDRLELMAELATPFREAVTFPDEATVGMTDEQYVRNCLDSLFRDTGKAAA